MLADEEHAKPYARALFESAQDLNILAEIREDMATLKMQWENSAELREFCTSYHSESIAGHRQDVADIWGDSFHPIVIILLTALSEAAILRLIPLIIKDFFRLSDIACGIVHVNASFATPPDDSTCSQILEKARKVFGQNAVLRTQIDSSLIAGVIVQTQDLRIDASLLGRLQRLRHGMQKMTTALD